MARLQQRMGSRRQRVWRAVWVHGAGHGGVLPGHCNGQSLPCGLMSLLDAIGSLYVAFSFILWKYAQGREQKEKRDLSANNRRAVRGCVYLWGDMALSKVLFEGNGRTQQTR